MTDHHIIESIYFFDPNGIRLELTTPTASQQEMEEHAKRAHEELRRWTERRRRGSGDVTAVRIPACMPGPLGGLAACGSNPRLAPDPLPQAGEGLPCVARSAVERTLKLAAIDVKPGAAMESQSGLQMLRPRIYGAYAEPTGRRKIAAIVMHPASNFMGHYLHRAARRARHLLHGAELALRRQRHRAADGAGDPGPRRRRQVPARGGLRPGRADRQLGRRGARELLPGAGRAIQRRHLRRRRPHAPEPERSAAGRRHRAVRRARGALEAAARLDRPVGDRRARPARSRPRARHVRRAPCGAVQRRVPRALSTRRSARGATASRHGCSSGCACCAARRARRATSRSSCTARTPTRAASTCRSTPTIARRAACGAMRDRSTTRPTRWAARPR